MNASTPSEEPTPAAAAAMEGRGTYNRHARQQAAAGALAVAALERAARAVDPGPDDRPLLIADYGSSQGRNSLHPVRAAIATLRARFDAERPICVTHTDLPDNDFSALFHVLQTDPDSYLRGQPNVFASAVGCSFYESVLAPAQVVLGWSSMAAQWLSQAPCRIPGHFHSLRAAAAEREAFAAQAAEDWRTFLSLRARELRPSGRLVIVLPATGDTGLQGIEPLFDAANDSISELVACGTIGAGERERMVVADCIRSRAQLLAPFAMTGSFEGLAVEHCEVLHAPDAMWDHYREHGDTGRLATQRARFFRATFGPSLATALDPGRPPADRLAFGDVLEAALVRRLTGETFEMLQTIAVIVVAQ